MFDLETAIHTWRHLLQQRRAFLPDDLDELEQHLRDFVLARVATGLGEEQAFRQAVARIGDLEQLNKEYQKVRLVKKKREAALLRSLSGELIMWKNYLVTTYRNLRRYPGYTALNVGGLALGLAVCLIIGLFVQHKLSYDRHNEHADRVVRVIRYGERSSVNTPPGLARAIEAQFPEVEHAVTVQPHGRRAFFREDEVFFIEDLFSADPAFLDVFTVETLAGDPRSALATPNQLVLTESVARRLFGDADPLGQVLNYERLADYEVAAVVTDPPLASHFRYGALRSFSEAQRATRQSSTVQWMSFQGGVLYLRLHSGVSATAFEEKLRAFEDADNPYVMPEETKLTVQKLTDIHLAGLDLNGELAAQSDWQTLHLFSTIGLLMLLLACINYINLATARGAQRSREVGVRKVVGAKQGQLTRQFLGESVVLGLLAVPIVLVLAHIALPFLEALTGPLGRAVWELEVVVVLVALVVGVGVLAGTYPALFLSRYRPAAVLYGRGAVHTGKQWLRRGLVVTQFAIGVALIIVALVVHAQLVFVQHKDLGFDQKNVVWLAPQDLGTQALAFKHALQQQARVEKVSISVPPGFAYLNGQSQYKDPETGQQQWVDVIVVDGDFLETMKIPLLRGRSFEKELAEEGESTGYIINESAARLFGIEPENGQEAPIPTVAFGSSGREVIGVVGDLHLFALHEPVRPTMILLKSRSVVEQYDNYFLVRLTPGDTQEAIAQLESVWEQFNPDRPLDFTFLDERIQQQYMAERKLGQIFSICAGLAVLVACLGLIGLAAFSASQRTKEIGVRKALGASVSGIVVLLARELAALVFIGVAVAMPLTWWVMRQWLDNFAYHIPLSWWLFVVAGSLALLVALAAVSWQTFRAARTNPVDALRYE